MVGDQNGVLEMRGGLAVGGDGGPLVRKDADFFGSQIDHGLDGEGHARFEFWADAAFSKIGNLGIFMETAADAVSNKFANDAEAIFNGFGFDKVGDISNSVARTNKTNGIIKDCFRDRQETLGGGVGYSNRNGSGIVANPAVTNYSDIHLDNIPVLDTAGTTDAMNDLFIETDANMPWEFFISEESAFDSSVGHEL